MTKCNDPKPKDNVKAVALDDIAPAKAKEQLAATSDSQKAAWLGAGGHEPAKIDTPAYILRDGDHVTSNGNAFIVMGTDRMGDVTSGYGALGNTHCSAIDIVTGMQSINAKSFTEEGEAVNANPDSQRDAARIYLSQRSNIDAHFSLPAGKKGNTTDDNPASAIAMKADVLRLIARENIKLVCRTDQLNSKDGKMDNKDTTGYGIDLIGLAASTPVDQGLQPLVKGDNLASCLQQILQLLENFMNTFLNYTQIMGAWGDVVAKHTHYTGFYKHETAPDFEGIMLEDVFRLIDDVADVQAHMSLAYAKDLGNIKNRYLRKNSRRSIRSLYNNTN